MNGTHPIAVMPAITPNLMLAPLKPKRAKPKRTAEKDGSRLPADWQPDPQTIVEMLTATWQEDIDEQLAQFCDWWQSQPGVKAKKLDWDATWRVWMRNYLTKHRDRRKRPGPSQQRVTAQSIRDAADAVVAEEEAAGR